MELCTDFLQRLSLNLQTHPTTIKSTVLLTRFGYLSGEQMRTSLTKVSHQSFPHKTYEFLPVFYTQIWCVYQQLEKSKVTEHLLPLNSILKKNMAGRRKWGMFNMRRNYLYSLLIPHCNELICLILEKPWLFPFQIILKQHICALL